MKRMDSTVDLQSKMRKIQSAWSPGERSRRAEEARRRIVEFSRMIGVATDADLWAVGAPALDDVRRLSG
jgi:hypothetical protein